MKTLYLVGGTMGVGKTTVCQLLKRRLPRCVFLDGDWCWDADPFVVTEETQNMVMGNIAHLLQSFLDCSEYENVVFCWVMHRQEIVDELLSRLRTDGVRVLPVSLVCEEAELRRRLQRDVDAGVRLPDILERSAARIPLYAALYTLKVDVTSLSPAETAEALMNL